MTDPTPETTPTRDEAVPTGWKLVPAEPTPSADASLAEAFAPFLAIRDAVSVQDAIKLVSKDRFDDMTPVSVTVTKAQYLRAFEAFRAAMLASAPAPASGGVDAAAWREGDAPKDGDTYLFHDPVLGVIYGHWYDGDDEPSEAGWTFQDFVGDYVEGVDPDGWMPLPSRKVKPHAE